MNADKGADKLRHAAEVDPGPNKDSEKAHQADTEAAEAHAELTQPELSKGRPKPSNGGSRPSNAGTDGP